MNVLAYLLYGAQPEYLLELRFSILTALRQAAAVPDRGFDPDLQIPELQIVVLSDQPDPLPGLPVEILPLTAADMALWTLDNAYSHRAKPLALRRLLQHFGAPVVLIDTDTYLLGDPARLFERVSATRSLLHSSDGYTLGSSAEWKPLLAKAPDLNPDTPMLNSGVIGLDPANTQAIDQAVLLIDRWRALEPVFNIEQAAVASALGRVTSIAFSDDLVAHYWGHTRPFVHLAISRFLDAHADLSPAALVAASADVDLRLPPKRLRDRVAAKLLGRARRWHAAYEYAWLCYRTALDYAGRDAEVANLWMQAAIASLKTMQAAPSPAALERDFPALHAGALDHLSWLAPNLARAWKNLVQSG